MSKKKKQQANGFLLFMREMQAELQEQGRNVPMRDMPLLAGPRWTKLPDRDRALYNARAKAERRAGGGGVGATGVPRLGAMDCAGELLSERRDMAAELEARRTRERSLIKSSLPEGSAVILTSFIFIDIQSLCELNDKPDHLYQPCEIALVCYTLHSGISRTFHRFIEPGPLPLGYRYEAQKCSEATHEVPISGFDRAVDDYRQLFCDVEDFVSPGGGRDIPALFTSRESVPRVEWCLEWLAAKAGMRNRLNRLYEAEALLCELSTHRDGRGPTVHQAKDLFSTTIYDHSMGTRCEWHEERENKHCSLGVVNKYSYVLSDTLCPKYSISLAPGHLPPPSANQPEFTSYTPSSSLSSMRSSRAGSRATSPPPHTSHPHPPRLTHMRGVPGMTQQFEGISLMGRGRGRGRGFIYREPRSVGQQQNF